MEENFEVYELSEEDLEKIENLTYLQFIKFWLLCIPPLSETEDFSKEPVTSLIERRRKGPVEDKVNLILALTGARKQAPLNLPRFERVEIGGNEYLTEKKGHLVPSEEYERWIDEIEELGLICTSSEFEGEYEHEKGFDLYVTRYPEMVEYAEKAIETRSDKAIGKALDYPECCVEEYVNGQGRDWNLKELSAERQELISICFHEPCNPDCKESLKQAERIKSTLEKVDFYSPPDALLEELKTGPGNAARHGF